MPIYMCGSVPCFLGCGNDNCETCYPDEEEPDCKERHESQDNFMTFDEVKANIACKCGYTLGHHESCTTNEKVPCYYFPSCCANNNACYCKLTNKNYDVTKIRAETPEETAERVRSSKLETPKITVTVEPIKDTRLSAEIVGNKIELMLAGFCIASLTKKEAKKLRKDLKLAIVYLDF